MFDISQQMEVFPTTVDLKRIDPSLNMRRFYRMSVQPDLFGGACLVREWGRIGFRGQMLIEQHPDEGHAVTALMKLAATKKRRGYQAFGNPSETTRNSVICKGTGNCDGSGEVLDVGELCR